MPRVVSFDTPKRHRRWLRLQLALQGIDHDYLVALVILLERIVHDEQQRLVNHPVPKPFYRITNGKGEDAKAWAYAAEAALWLRYRHYDPYEWFKAACGWSVIRRRLSQEQRVPLSLMMPITRLSTERLKVMEKNYLRWKQYHDARV